MTHYTDPAQFVDDCSTGADIEFTYHGVGYGVLGWTTPGPTAYRKREYGFLEQQFTSADALLDGFLVDGVPLRAIILDVDLQLH